MFATDRSLAIAELAREVEARGFSSLWVPEHTHIPTSRATPPPTGDAELAEDYRRTLDPLIAMAMAAAVTERLVVGSGILLPAQREPIVTAKAVATLDQQAGGRVALGIGFGWNRDEIEHHGVEFARRRDVCREHVLAMRALWSDDIAEFHGEFVDFGPSWSWPKPARAGGPPVLLGGAAGPTLFEHVAEYGDGWIPIGGAGVAGALDELRAAFERRGRDPSTLEIVPFGTIPDRGKLDHYRTIGVTEVVLRLPAAGRDDARRGLDRLTSALQ
jgi:probable F420-dependent oxidoreductase